MENRTIDKAFNHDVLLSSLIWSDSFLVFFYNYLDFFSGFSVALEPVFLYAYTHPEIYIKVIFVVTSLD